MNSELEKICQRAVACRHCFSSGYAQPAYVDLAQPRWIGPQYGTSRPRILILMLNPGKGDYNAQNDRVLRDLLIAYKNGNAALEDLFAHQATDMPNWGKGRFSGFYVRGLNIRLEEVAFANMAWCATVNDTYPAPMLNACFERHTRPLLRLLKPDAILLSGSRLNAFRARIQEVAPKAKIIHLPHYANRLGLDKEEELLARVRSELDQMRQEHGGEKAASVNSISPCPGDEGELGKTHVDSPQEVNPARDLVNLRFLRRCGFTDEHFRLIHHIRKATLARHEAYLEGTAAYQRGGNNEKVGRRMAFIVRELKLNSAGLVDSSKLRALANAARQGIP